jgi:glycosyltransferase involved in cell wall biosynthesis
MKIAIFTPTFLPKCSGAEIFHHNLALRLAALGHEPVVVMPRGLKRRLDASPLAPGYATVGYPSNQWSLFKKWPFAGYALSRWTLDGFQARHRFDVWHSVVLSPAGACFADWQSKRGVAGLVRAVGDDVPTGGVSRIPSHVRKSISRAQCVVSLSAGMTAGLVQAGVHSSRITEIPNAVDLECFRRSFDRSAFLAAKGIKGRICLCVARNHPQKDLPTLFRAFAQLCQSLREPVTLVVAGRGMKDYPLDSELGSSVRLLELTPSNPLEFPPSELVEWYLASDLFVLTSELEGFSTALVEAMAAGLPVVATDVAGIRGRVESGKNGWLHPFRNAEGIAESMRQLLLDEDQRRRFGEAARQSAACFSWDNTVSAYDSLYKNLVRNVSERSGYNS